MKLEPGINGTLTATHIGINYYGRLAEYFFKQSCGSVDAWNMVLGVIQARTVNIFKNAYRNTERTWWETPKKKQRWIPAKL